MRFVFVSTFGSENISAGPWSQKWRTTPTRIIESKQIGKKQLKRNSTFKPVLRTEPTLYVVCTRVYTQKESSSTQEAFIRGCKRKEAGVLKVGRLLIQFLDGSHFVCFVYVHVYTRPRRHGYCFTRLLQNKYTKSEGQCFKCKGPLDASFWTGATLYILCIRRK